MARVERRKLRRRSKQRSIALYPKDKDDETSDEESDDRDYLAVQAVMVTSLQRK